MKTLTLSTLLVVLACLLARANAAPFITEFLASNTTGLADEDGNRPDWIEIFNPDGAPLDLGGYRLTDDIALPGKWVFPAGAVVPPGGYMVVFASGNDRATIGFPLHTNFSLNVSGEYLAFSDPGGAILSEYTPAFPVQTADVSYGVISTTPGAASAYFNTPTPGAANNPATAPAEPVAFSLTSRTFNSGQTLNVALSVTSPTATIRYTLDRSVPTASSPLYSGTPIAVSASTRIRARAFEPGRPDGPVRSHTYLVLDAAAQVFTSTIPIVIQHSWNSGHPSATAPTGTTPEDTKLAVMMVFEPKAPSGLARMTNLPDVATPSTFERRGSSTFDAAKYNQTVELQTETSEDNAVPVLGMPANGDWVLSAPFQFDRSLMHNDLIYRLSNEAGRYASRTKFVELFQSAADATVNGDTSGAAPDYYGVYSFQEKLSRDDDRVDVENMTTADNAAPNVQGGYILKVDRLDNGDAGIPAGARTFAWVDPREFTPYPTHLPIATAAQKTYIQNYINSTYAALRAADFMSPTTGYRAWLDAEAAVDHHILSIAPKSADAFRLSGYWHKSRFGKMIAGPIWDFDRAQGSTDGRDLLPTTWRGDVGDLGTDPFHDGAPGGVCWYGDMFQDSNFWQLWVDRYHAMRQGALSTARVMAVIDEMANTVNPGDAANTPAKRNFIRWASSGNTPRGTAASTPGTNGTYAGEIAWLKNWWTSRLNFIDGQFSRPTTASAPTGPIVSGSNVTLTSTTLSTPGAKIYYTTNGTDPRLAAIASATRTTLLSTLLTDTQQMFAIVPTSATTGGAANEWRGTDGNGNGNNQDDFSHASWFTTTTLSTNGTHGVGYDDTTATGVDYRPFMSIRWNGAGTQNPTAPVPVTPANNTSTMRNVNGSCYVRIPFTVSAADAALLVAPNRAYLHVRYDDGIVAWINGTEVKRSTNATGVPPDYNSVLATTHDDNAAIVYEDMEITANMSAIHAGQNILAIQLMNASIGSSDALLQVKMSIQSPPAPYTPGISPQAIEYTTPINVTAPTQLFVRTLHPNVPSDPPTQSGGGVGTVPNGTAWSAPTLLYYFPGAVSASAASIRISEVNYHPPAPTADEITAGFLNSNDFEFIRITNTGATPVDLTGAYFDNGLTFTFTPGLQNWLPVGASVVIVENLAAFQSRYGTGFTVVGEFGGELDDGGEHIVLRDKNGVIIADFTYNDTAPWPVQADGERSLIFLGGNPALPASWRASLDPGGSGVSDYAVFKSRYFNGGSIPAALQDPDDDPDDDGIVNFAEFGLALNPLTPDAPSFSNPILSVRRRPAAGTNLAYTLQSNADGAGWIDGGAPTGITPNADGSETAIYPRQNPGAAVELLRMKITSP